MADATKPADTPAAPAAPAPAPKGSWRQWVSNLWHDYVGANRHNTAAVRADNRAKAAEAAAKERRTIADQAKADLDTLIQNKAPQEEIARQKAFAHQMDAQAKIAESDARGLREAAGAKLATAKQKAEARKAAGKPAAAGDSMHTETTAAGETGKAATKGGGQVTKDAAEAPKPKAKMGDPDGLFGSLFDKTKDGDKAVGGFVGTLKNNFNPKTAGNSGVKVFGRAAGTVVGAYMVADSFRGKKADGEDRGAAGRVLEFIAGGGVAAGSALTGKALHLRGV